MAKRIDLKDVNIYYGNFHAVADVALSVPPRSVTALIGPSGCGKSTVLRSLNRMHEVTPGARVEGSVLLDGEDIYGAGVDPVGVRRTIGMVFPKAEMGTLGPDKVHEHASVGSNMLNDFTLARAVIGLFRHTPLTWMYMTPPAVMPWLVLPFAVIVLAWSMVKSLVIAAETGLHSAGPCA